MSTLHSAADAPMPMPFETYPEESRYVVRLDLPAETDDHDVAATYRNGILELSVGWQDEPAPRKIRVLTLTNVI